MITSYEDLSIGKYLQVQKAMQEGDEVQRQLTIISILSDKSEDELLALPLLEFRTLAAGARFLETEVQVPQKTAKVYEIGGWRLEPTLDIRKMTTAQYIDFQALAQKGEQYLPELLSCLLVPKGCLYNIGYEIDTIQELIRESMNVPTCLALSAFFLQRLQKSIRSMLTCWQWIVKTDRTLTKAEKAKAMQEIQTAIHLLGDGAGSIASIPSAKRAGAAGKRYGRNR